MSANKIGVYVCQCGGNIGDHVDVDEVVAAVEKEPGVSVAKTAMFTCSDATQSEIIADAQEQGLDGLVIASCSPKLHTYTFRDVARRAGMNPFQYTQVNVREQCSWTHTDDHEGATEKAVRLVRAGINRTRLTEPLEPIVVETTPKSLVVGGGVAGLRAALGLAEIGLAVFLVEKESQLGGWVGGLRRDVPARPQRRRADRQAGGEGARAPGDHRLHQRRAGRQGRQLRQLRGDGRHPRRAARDHPVWSSAQSSSPPASTPTSPPTASSATGMDGVVTIAEFKKLLDGSAGPLEYNGRPVKTVAYIYCVGSRQGEERRGRQHLLLALLLHRCRARRDPGRGPAGQGAPIPLLP